MQHVLVTLVAVIFSCNALMHAAVIHKAGKACLPANVVPVDNFIPEKFFNGKNWFNVASDPYGEAGNCNLVNMAFDTSLKNVSLTVTTLYENGIVHNETILYAQDSDSNAVYDHYNDNYLYQFTVIETDYTGYAVITSCMRPGNDLANIFILARKPQVPSDYDAIVANLAAEGFATDASHLVLYDVSGCPK